MKITAFPCCRRGAEMSATSASAVPYYFCNPFMLYTHVLLYSIFSTIRRQDNSHYSRQLFSNIYLGPVAAWCQVREIQLWKKFMNKLTVLAVIRPERRCVPARFRQSASRTTPFPFYYIVSSSSNVYRGRVAAWCQVRRRQICKKIHAEVNCIGCHSSWNVLHSTFSSICLKDNAVIILIHPQFFLNIYHGRVAALCQVCGIQLCSNFI